MITLTIDVRQYDCPFIDTTDDHPLSFSALQWSFNERQETLETRIMARASGRSALDSGLSTLRDHDMVQDVALHYRRGETALLRAVMNETNAMSAVREHGGYLTGPPEMEDGRELWYVGFDNERRSDRALADMERDNEFEVKSRQQLESDALFSLFQHPEAVGKFLTACESLSATEHATLRTAVEEGYFDEPRGATLATVSEEFGVSKSAASRNLRRGQRKVLSRLVEAMDEM
ncbi:MAG: helix-turn-helix domain-containing protein [Halobacteriales archaeon SW_9_67_25]|nr:MAG: helix-turn-helix domain-containing protein [Halobacteriales archaeon SW_9_67_25]